MSQRYIGGVVTETTNVAQSPWTGEWTQQAALQGFAGAQAPLKVANSLRFRSSASAYLSRTPSVAGNRQTWTWSGWVKRGSLGGNQGLFSVAGTTDATYFLASISSDTIYIGNYSTVVLATTQVLRDPSAWYHLVIVLDTTQATANNRLKLYLNGIQITAFSNNNIATYYTQNSSQGINQTASHSIGRETQGSVYYFDGYLANVNFIDGQALPPTAFGTINKENGVWSPSAYTGTYGTNGFKLNFSNGTSTTTLGYDSSGNGNNWTTNNISLTAGSTYDWMIDSPTKFPGSSYGVGNYAVLNPLEITTTTKPTDGNLNYSPSSTSPQVAISTIAVGSSGKWYAEFTKGSATSSWVAGVIGPGRTDTYVGAVNSIGYFDVGQIYKDGSQIQSGLAAFALNDVLGIAIDAGAKTVQFYKNGAALGTAISYTYSNIWFACGNYLSGLVYNVNFGQRPFAYTPPSGYKSLCTQNLPGVTIQNGAGYMAATLWAGNNASQSIVNTVNGVSFQPDFAWIKVRTVANDHVLVDVNRGVNKTLASNTTAAEITESLVTSFNFDGLTLAGNYQRTNQAGNTYIGWQWKAGGTAVTNTAGSITSSVSANTTSGFSVVTYTGNNTAGATVGHGLGVAPSMIIVKSRATSSYWFVYHVALGATQYLSLNATDAAGSTVTLWNNTAPTSSVITLGTNSGSNNSGNMVAYCFAAIPGYSAFGSYTGNGSANGPFVYCGFRPRYVLVKCSSNASYGYWDVIDTSRDPYNGAYHELFPNDSSAEYTGGRYTDILSNGFKQRTSAYANVNGETYIYAAFAENPFQNALAR